MKHPEKKVLQDYFEDLLDDKTSLRVKRHLLKCDHCSKVLAALAMADEAFKQSSASVPKHLQKKVAARAENLLLKRRERARMARDKIASAQERQDRIKEWAIEMKDFFTHEAKLPALQVAGISLFVVILIQAQRYEEKTISFNLIDNSVQTYERID